MGIKVSFCKTVWSMGISLVIGLAGLSSPAQAFVLYTGDSYIDWTSLKLSGIPVDLYGQSSLSESHAEDGINSYDDSQSFSGWTDTFTSATSSVPTGQAFGSTDNDFLMAQSSANVTGFDTGALVQDCASRFASFIADEAGILTVSFDYSLSLDLATGATEEYAFGDSGVNLLINDSKSDTLTFGSSDGLFSTVVDGGTFHSQKNGTITLNVPFDKGEEGSFQIYADTHALVYKLSSDSSVVPEPATLALLGLGLIGGVFIRKQKEFS